MTTKGTTFRKISGAARRTELLHHAMLLVEMRGWERLTMFETAQRVGCSESLVRSYFKNRDGLCKAVAEHCRARNYSPKILRSAKSLGFID